MEPGMELIRILLLVTLEMVVILILFTMGIMIWVKVFATNKIVVEYIRNGKRKSAIVKEQPDKVKVGKGSDATTYNLKPYGKIQTSWPGGFFPSWMKIWIDTYTFPENRTTPFNYAGIEDEPVSGKLQTMATDESMMKMAWREMREYTTGKGVGGKQSMYVLIGLGILAVLDVVLIYMVSEIFKFFL